MGVERSQKQMILGSLMCLIASVAWGAMFPVAGSAMQHIDAFHFTLIRYSWVAVLLAIMLWAKEGKQAFRFEGKGKSLLFFGTMAFTVYNILIFWGQYLMGDPDTIAASLMEAMMPMISIGLLWIIHKKRPSRHAMLSMVVALIGALFVITKGNWQFFFSFHDQMLPLLFLFIAVIGWVVYTIGGKQFNGWSILRYSTLSCVLGTAVTFGVVAIASLLGYLEVPSLSTVWSIKAEMGYMIVIAGLLALLSWNAGIKWLGAENGILFINFVPITTLVIMAFQGYSISMYEYYGTFLVVLAIVYHNMSQRKETIHNAKQERKLSRTDPLEKPAS